MNGFLINGMSTAGTRLGQSSLNLSVAAIDQFKIREGFFLPSEGPNNAGEVSLVTKAGTNRIHGEAFEFVRNNAFDARNYFESRPAPFHRNQFGGAVGGPILKDRLFFFAHYEGRRQILSSTVKATVPSTKMFGGDFSEMLALPTPVQIYDSATFDAATGQRLAFAGNIIPSDRINPMAAKLLAYYLPGASYSPENVGWKSTDHRQLQPVRRPGGCKSLEEKCSLWPVRPREFSDLRRRPFSSPAMAIP